MTCSSHARNFLITPLFYFGFAPNCTAYCPLQSFLKFPIRPPRVWSRTKTQSAVSCRFTFTLEYSVQRLLDAWGQRGSWMPSNFTPIHLAKFLTNFFLVVHKKFSNSSRKISDDLLFSHLLGYPNFSLFRISF